MATIKPLFDRVLVQRLEQPDQTRSGLFLPDTAKEKPSEGVVLAVGAGSLSDSGAVYPLSVQVGDRVMFRKYGGNEIKVDGEDRIILRESDILGVLS